MENGDAVGVADGGDAVGDEDGGASAHQVAEVVEDFVFSVGVDGREGVVEDENAGAAEDGAGDGGALLLASGEGDAALADCCVIAVGEGLDIVSDVGGLGGGVDLGEGGVWRLRRRCFRGWCQRREKFLAGRSRYVGEGSRWEFADGAAIDEDGAGSGIVDARDEADEGGLAGAGGADDGEAGAGGNAEVDVVENGDAVVGEVEVAEFDFADEIGRSGQRVSG